MIGNRLIRFLPLSQHSSSQLVNATRNYSPAERLPLNEAQKKKYPQVEQNFSEDGYPILKFKPSGRNIFVEKSRSTRLRSTRKYKLREETMKENQDWPSVWPTAKTFVPSAVPLPLRQSYETKPGAVPRGKYANTELLKVANFLHLSPDAIKRQCMAIRKFCTKWPEGLDLDEDVRSHFPVTYVTRDYCHSSPTIRDPRARIVELKINLDDLKLEGSDRRKFIELARQRYDASTNILTLTVDACPVRVQNRDYADYLLSAVYFESQEHQGWEKDWVDEDRIFKIDIDKYRKEVEEKLGLKRESY